MPRTTVRTTNPDTIEVEYETFGSSDDPALLLVMGFTAQLIAWDADFCEQLAAKGHHVVRFDNRDCGLSTKLDGQQVDLMAVMEAAAAGQAVPPTPYTLSDMANDAFGLLDALGIERAHVLGASMGGMIGQTMAIERPERVLSLISVMSSSGNLQVGTATEEARNALMTPPPTEREAYVANSARAAVWASKKHVDLERLAYRAGLAFDRSFYPDGAPRQLAAVYASGDRTEALGQVRVPTLVIHGRDDTLIQPDGGEHTAAAIPEANLLLLAHMGHDLPQPLWPTIIDAVISHTSHAVEPARKD